MSDPTETARKEILHEINSDPSERERLEKAYGKVWSTFNFVEAD